MYTTNNGEACLHCINNSQANIVVVENKKQFDKILEIKHKAPSIKAIIQYEGEPDVASVLSVSSMFSLRLMNEMTPVA